MFSCYTNSWIIPQSAVVFFTYHNLLWGRRLLGSQYFSFFPNIFPCRNKFQFQLIMPCITVFFPSQYLKVSYIFHWVKYCFLFLNFQIFSNLFDELFAVHVKEQLWQNCIIVCLLYHPSHSSSLHGTVVYNSPINLISRQSIIFSSGSRLT
jgi:hypothetical protein